MRKHVDKTAMSTPSMCHFERNMGMIDLSGMGMIGLSSMGMIDLSSMGMIGLKV